MLSTRSVEDTVATCDQVDFLLIDQPRSATAMSESQPCPSIHTIEFCDEVHPSIGISTSPMAIAISHQESCPRIVVSTAGHQHRITSSAARGLATSRCNWSQYPLNSSPTGTPAIEEMVQRNARSTVQRESLWITGIPPESSSTARAIRRRSPAKHRY